MTDKPEAFETLVLRAMPLPPAWITAKQLYAIMDVGSMQHIKNTLLGLVKAGKVARFGPIECPAYRRIDLPEFKPDKTMMRRIQEYRDDLAAYKEMPRGNLYTRPRRT